MKIKCIARMPSEIKNLAAKEYLEKEYPGGYENLVIGQKYLVYGIGFIKKRPVYYIRTEEKEVSPYPYSSHFFELKDRRLSSYWRWYISPHDDGIFTYYIVFPEWGSDSMFYENLIDGAPQAEAIFAKYKKLMDEEFSN